MGYSVRVVTSVSNRPGMAWQAVVFAHAWRPYLALPPLVMVHAGDGEPLLPAFRPIEDSGAGELVRARDRSGDGPWYPPRNAPGALLDAPSDDADLTVLCDGDMVPVGPVDFGSFGAGPGKAVMDVGPYGYLRTPGGEEDDWLPGACELLGVPYAALCSRPWWGGVPHVVHRDDRRRLGGAWLDADRRIGERFPAAVRGPYSMWTFVLATLALGLEPVLTDVCGRAWERDGMRPAAGRPVPRVVHYYNSDSGFAKNDYGDEPGAAERVWDVRPRGEETLTDVVRRAIAAAAAAHRLAGG